MATRFDWPPHIQRQIFSGPHIIHLTMKTCWHINSSQSNFEFKYLGEFKTEFKNLLGYKSGTQVVLIHEKTRVKSNCATKRQNTKCQITKHRKYKTSKIKMLNYKTSNYKRSKITNFQILQNIEIQKVESYRTSKYKTLKIQNLEQLWGGQLKVGFGPWPPPSTITVDLCYAFLTPNLTLN